MKLLFCRLCKDVAALSEAERACRCGRSKGRYLDGNRVRVWGPAAVLGIKNLSLEAAVGRRGEKGAGKIAVDAYVFPEGWETVSEGGEA